MSPTPARLFHEAALLAMVASGFLALLGSGELDLPTVVILPIALLLRVAMIGGWLRWSIPPALITLSAALYIPFYVADAYWLSHGDFFGATVHMICFIAVVKLLTAASARDFLYLKLIAGMELLAAALLSAELTFFLYLAVFLLSSLAAFTSGEVLESMVHARNLGGNRSGGTVSVSPGLLKSRLALMSVSLFFGLMIVTAGLFFVLPRTARAAFLHFGSNRSDSRMSSEVTLGDLGRLEQNSAAVMHVQSYDGRSLEGLHWRGAVLSRFNGTRWDNPAPEDQTLLLKRGELMFPVSGTPSGPSLGYTVQLSEIAPDTLFFAGTPQSISIQATSLFRSPNGMIRAPRLGLVSYGAYSSPLARDLTPLTAAQRRDFLDLPALDPRIAALARTWTAAQPDPMQAARAIETHFHRDFGYSLDALDAPVADPLANFLFDRKKGHCEYFASGMTVMLRTLGIPARVATGFYGGVFNSISGWQVLRASDAHSWVEAWLPGRGWTTFDPTPFDPAAAPASGLMLRASLLLDAIEQFWRDWVVTYDGDHQRALVSRVQDARRLWQWSAVWPSLPKLTPRAWIGLAAAAAGLFVALRFGPALAAFWSRGRRLARARRGHAESSDATLLYERMLRLLERRGWRREPTLTPAEFARTLPPSELALLVEDLTRAYNQVRFGGHPEAAPRLAHLLQRIEALTQ
jgi:transglutaminase-like putative cysteine protease